MAKRVRLNGVDRISSLPNEILGHILSFLPTKVAAKTSILSTRWRFLFDFVFNFDLKLRKGKSDKAIESFTNFVNGVLLSQNRMGIEKLSLRLGKGVNRLAVFNWITAAVSQDVQHLDLCIRIRKFTALPSLLFTCRTLVTLKLDMNLILNVPDNFCLPTLKTLHLSLIEFLDDGSINRLFSSCSSLEDMVLEFLEVDNLSKFDVSHPLLKRLTIWSCLDKNYHYNSSILTVMDVPSLVHLNFDDVLPEGCLLLNLPSLLSAEVKLKKYQTTDSSHSAVTDFFTGIRNVKSLDLSVKSLKLLLRYGLSHLLSEVVQLEIVYEDCPLYNKKSMKRGLSVLLKDMQRLEKLAFSMEPCFNHYLPKEVPLCLERSLKEINIEILSRDGKCECKKSRNYKPLMKFAKYLLKNTTYLKELNIFTECAGENKRLKMIKELKASERKSKHCLILVL